MGVVGILAVSGVALAIAVAIGTWILRPVDRAAKNLQHPTQFTVIDFFCLFFLIEFPTDIIPQLLMPRIAPRAAVEYKGATEQPRRGTRAGS